ncbi:MAG: rRNA pseudouridine synthase [Pseudomonadota bacterium]|nr:rRNA pseudouridine synthase [Pseudomonadota bacterium]
MSEDPKFPRLSKTMADRGLCSRREADVWIERGWVRVDGLVVRELGARVDPASAILVAPEARNAQSQLATFLVHKPVGYVSGQAEDGHKPASTLIVAANRWSGDTVPRDFAPAQLLGLAPAGRLDIDSTGLLVLTQDGRVARTLIGEGSEVEKEYLVRVGGQLDARGLKLLCHGLSLDGQPLRPAQVSWQNQEQLRFVLREGRKRQIRRMCEAVGLQVLGLKRVRIGAVMLGALPAGQWRYLAEGERFDAPSPPASLSVARPPAASRRPPPAAARARSGPGRR